jgi:hypothetical protein
MTDPNDHYRGNFRWFYEVEPVFDLNAVEFMLERPGPYPAAGLRPDISPEPRSHP